MQLNYKEQLADSRWLKKKADILLRDNYTCQKCGAQSHLNVHHLSYENGKLAWEYPNEQLITLCEQCHENAHDVVTYPKIGRFYTYHHSDYQNDMVCFHIDRKNNFVCLFGVDDGAYGSAYVDYFTFEEFYYKCRNSELKFNVKDDDYSSYTIGSLFHAYNNLMRGKAFIDAHYPFTKEQCLTFTQNKVKSVIGSRQDIVDIFDALDFMGGLE